MNDQFQSKTFPGQDWLSRTRMLLGNAGVERLSLARVSIFGLGAVGCHVVEALARSGVGMFRLVDFDVFKESNLNRQLLALHSTMGRPKVEVAAERVADINPAAKVEVIREFAHSNTLPGLLAGGPDVVVDAVDSLNPKVEIIASAQSLGLPVYSALGAATRVEAERVDFGPLFSAQGCPLGRLVRKRLRRRGIEQGDLWCVFSREERNRSAVGEAEREDNDFNQGRPRRALGSLSTMTGLFGLRLAHEVVMRLAGR